MSASVPSSRSFLLPPRLDGPVVARSGLLGGALGLLYLQLMRRWCVTSVWLLLGGCLPVVTMGFKLATITSRSRIEVLPGLLRTWKWRTFGTAETVDLSAATAVEIITISVPQQFSAKRYSIKISFTDRPDEVIGPWLSGAKDPAVRKLFDDVAEAIREQIRRSTASRDD